MLFRGMTIKPEWIYEVVPHMRAVILRKCPVLKITEMAEKQIGSLIFLKLDSDKELQDAKFEHVQHIKKSARPEDRVADHELRDSEGNLDLSKYDRLVEMRKTPGEKAMERESELRIMNEMKKRNIEYNGPLKGGY